MSDRLQPAEAWFAQRGWAPFEFQREAWRAYLAGENGLLHAATGTGKTYAAWFGPLLEYLAEDPTEATQAPPLRVVWITPLRALAADTEAALQAPLQDLGLPWTVERRTSDTSSSVRARQDRRLPTALITTPESLSLLLSRPEAPRLFCQLRAIVVDEWHELMGTKRGVQTELALARLRALAEARPRTWGLSATLGNLATAATALLGSREPPARLVRGLAPKSVRIDTLLPESVERFPWAGHLGQRMLPQAVAAIEEGRTALVFTNTRAHAEFWYQQLLEARPDWAGILALHHGSLDAEVREWVENGLREGRLRCVVATSTLDLGVDFAPVDRVLQVGSPKGVARLLQRAGRSGHRPGLESRVTGVPTNALELVEFCAVREAAAAGQLEARVLPEKPLDVLVQHAVTVALGGGFVPEALYEEVRGTYSYRSLQPDEWQWVLDFVARGGQSLTAYPEYRRVVAEGGRLVVADRDVATRHRQSIGTIVSEAMLTVQYWRGGKLGQVEESFVARLKPGDRFVFAGRPLEFVRLRDMTAWVRRANTVQGAIPRWTGARMPLSPELAAAVRRRLAEAGLGVYEGPEMEAVRPVLELQARWSRLPAVGELLIERLKTREGHHLYFYPVEGRSVHEGMAALFAYRLARHQPITFTLAANDYGFELLSAGPAPLEAALSSGLLAAGHLLEDIPASLNAAELARRQFREIARVAGLVFPGPPGRGKTARQLQASSSLFYDVFAQYDPDNLLLQQAHREVLERQLQHSRLAQTLRRLAAGQVTVVDVRRPTPLAFPLMVDRLREQLSSEKLADRVRRMQAQLEKAAGELGRPAHGGPGD